MSAALEQEPKPGGANREAILGILARGPRPFEEVAGILFKQARPGIPVESVAHSALDMFNAGDLYETDTGLIGVIDQPPAEKPSVAKRVADAARKVGAIGLAEGGTPMSWVADQIKKRLQD